MKKILIILLMCVIIIAFALLLIGDKVKNESEAIALVKEKYNVSDYDNITNITNGWVFEFLKVEGNCSLECVETHVYFDVYKNGSVIRTEKTINVTKIENKNEALNYVLYKFPEFKNIKKCKFEEKQMCHQDIVIEKLDSKWNITFMNETKECNNECIIEHYFSFTVDKNGKINKNAEERKITLEDIFKHSFEYPIEHVKYLEHAQLKGWVFSELWLPWNKFLVVDIINGSEYLVFYNEDKKKVYISGHNESLITYNILLEKFSVKTINNESDVLEAFERYWMLFCPRPQEDCGVMWKIDSIKGLQPFVKGWQNFNASVESVKEGGEGFENRLKPKIVKEGANWKANVSAFYFLLDVMYIVDYNTLITDRGAVIILNKTETKGFGLFYPM